MKIHRKMLLLSALFGALATPACRDGGTDPSAGESGTVSFTYVAGSQSRSYTASGAVSLSGGSAQFGTWAVAGRSGSELLVMAFVERTGSRGDGFFLYLPQVNGPRTDAFTEECGNDPDAICPYVSLVTGMMLGDDDSFTRSCALESGTVTVTAISDGRVRGTFSGTGECFVAATDADEAFRITNGTFDVPVRPELNWD
jgi:hypothetical protein